MQVERYSWEYGVHQNFSNAREIQRSDNEIIYEAEENGKFYLIYDRSLQADFICPLQPGIEDPIWVDVMRFESAEERRQYFNLL